MAINVTESGFSSADFVLAEFHKFGINLRKVNDSHVSVSFNETTSIVDLDELVEIFAELKEKSTPAQDFLKDSFFDNKAYKELPNHLKRTSKFLK